MIELSDKDRKVIVVLAVVFILATLGSIASRVWTIVETVQLQDQYDVILVPKEGAR